MTQTSVRSVCPYCGVGCGIVMQVRDNQVIKVSGDKQHPTNFGRLCTKGSTCAQPLTHPGRMAQAFLRHERKRDPGQVGMDQAISETARRLKAILLEHGPDALSFYVSGQMSLEAQYLINKLAKGFIRTHLIESNSRLCMASAGAGYKLSLGADGPPGSYQDFDKAELFFVIGANMADCHPILFLRLMDRLKAGARLIVVDPRRNATADKADLFLQIKPGSDLALLNGLLHLLVKNGHTDPEFIARFTEGWEALPDFLEDYHPARVASLTGLPEAQIRQAAQWIGEAAEWMSCWTMGLNQSTHGTWHTNALCNLHLATGAICRPGSGPFSLTGQPNAMGGREMGYMGPGLPGQRSALVPADREFIEDLWQIPRDSLSQRVSGGSVALFEDMQAGKIKACWIICTNPVASVPNRQTVIAGLQAAELVIAQDAFLDTETNGYADILLPAALWAEAQGVMINSERNLTLMRKAVDAPGQALPDWQIIARVACEMGYAEAFSYASAAEVFDEIKRAWNPKTGYDLRGASYERLEQTPLQWPCGPGQQADRNPIRYLNDGLGKPAQAAADGSKPHLLFPTASGKAMFFARPWQPAAEQPDADFPLVLNTGRLQHQWHTLTKTGKVTTLNKLNPGPFIEINPLDAARLGIAEKDGVEIRSVRGRAVLPAQISDRVAAGNCFAPFHWNDVYGEDLAINAVTHDAVDPISLQPEFKFSAVALSRVDVPQPDPLPLPTRTEAPHTMQTQALARILGFDTAPSIQLAPNENLYLQGFLLGLGSSQANAGLPTLPASAPLQPANRLIIEGILAGLFSRQESAQPNPSGSEQPPLLLLWSSQTGTVEAFAKSAAERLQEKGHRVRLASMDSIQAKELSQAGRALLLTSTFGDGEPPDNAHGLWQALAADNAPSLENLRFAVLAFGDSSYEQFCGFGRKLDERLHSLGGQRLAARVDCEPDYQEPASAWLDKLDSALAAKPVSVASAPRYSRQQPLPARLKHNRLLSGPDATKETRQFVFDLADSGLDYQAGDALGVWPSHCPEAVERLRSCLSTADAETVVTVKDKTPMPLIEALSRHLEIGRISPALLQLVFQRSGSHQLKRLLADEHKTELKDWLWGRQPADLLRELQVDLGAQELVDCLKPLQPRLYSIASSPKVHPREVHLTVSTVRYERGGHPRSGCCSGFLADRTEGLEVPIFVQKSANFRPPADPQAPMIMVGPGTGIAPFRAFLQERQAIGASGKNWLFFGEQHAASDFYYREELQAWSDQGHLQRLDTAFSRDQAQKIYVQQRMIEQGAQLWAWLEEGAGFYVCGDASHMARDVDAALKQVIRTHGGLDADEAQAYVAALAADKRYVRDVY
ncbi:sulfite reductase (NADPH) alpha subunit [Pseudomonas asplenii]|uniref:assimilatory sulfite reductase (NADPH) n=1 Tax=Pseudomonas asplenii TaxID=53407 RepID=A0A1H1Y4W7_9PSED|nr:bifunctional nitrate reductase/sulfite reductase flavoprotein subunit alpha [Pseudomonas asplenii]SDT16076.1 sulfite reductase (NADPH) alpha subunit [Pseudomonas asplenii]